MELERVRPKRKIKKKKEKDVFYSDEVKIETEESKSEKKVNISEDIKVQNNKEMVNIDLNEHLVNDSANITFDNTFSSKNEIISDSIINMPSAPEFVQQDIDIEHQLEPSIENTFSKIDISNVIINKHEVNKPSVESLSIINTISIEKPSNKIENSEETVVKCMYPDLENINLHQKSEIITSLQALASAYSEQYMFRVVTEANNKYAEFIKVLQDIDKYDLFALIHNFQSSRESFLKTYVVIHTAMSKLKRERNSLWRTVRKEVTGNGQCGDGCNVSISYSYDVKELDNVKFDNIKERLSIIRNALPSHTFNMYEDHLIRLKVEQYLHDFLKYFQDSKKKRTFEQESKKVSFTELDLLKKLISILFQFQRISIKDKAFYEICQKWLKTLVNVLYENGEISDYIFIINHVIRSPCGIRTWASQFIQVPIIHDCKNNAEDIFNCQCLNNILLVLYLVLKYAPDRGNFLRHVQKEFSDSSEKFILIDSDGEEEDDINITQDWSDEDVTSCLNQISLGALYEHIFLKADTMEVKDFSEKNILKIFAFSTTLIDILLIGLETYNSEHFTTTVEIICSNIRHVICYISSYLISSKNVLVPAIQAEFDRLVFHTVFRIYHLERLDLWKYLSMLPYEIVSKKMLWTLLWIFHSPHCYEEEVYSTKDVEILLKEKEHIISFVEKLKNVESKRHFLLNAYKSFLYANSIEDNFMKFIIHEICEILFVDELYDLMKEGSEIILFILKKYPHLLTSVFKEIENSHEKIQNLFIKMFEDLSVTDWIPEKEDIKIISDWLLSNSLSNPKNIISRKLLSKMNWEFNEQSELVLPLRLHQEVAILILEAYRTFDSKGNKWNVSNGITQIFEFANACYEISMGFNKKEDNGFINWAWQTLFKLKLHSLNQKNPSWIMIYDGYLRTVNLPDPKKDLWLQPLQQAYEEGHPTAAYLLLVMTNVGHSVNKLLDDGIVCLAFLMENKQYLGAIRSLYYIIPFFVKKYEELLANSKFLEIMHDLIVADVSMLSNITVGAVLTELLFIIKYQVDQASNISVECAVPLLKLWIRIVLKTFMLNKSKQYMKDFSTQYYFLLESILKMSFLNIYSKDCIIDLLFDMETEFSSVAKPQSTSFLKSMWKSSSNYPTMLCTTTFPKHALLGWAIILAESKQKNLMHVWNFIQKEIKTKKKYNIMQSMKDACKYLEIEHVPLEFLPVFRWAVQIKNTPISHHFLPLLWQQFFLLYFERVGAENEDPVSLGPLYFTSGYQNALLNSLKSHLNDTAEYYRKSAQNEHSSNDCSKESQMSNFAQESLNLKLWKLFRAFKLWLDNENLCLPNVCLSALDPDFSCDKLQLILNGDQNHWFDLVHKKKLDEEVNKIRQSFFIPKKSTCSSSKPQEHLSERIKRSTLNELKSFKPLECQQLNPPLSDFEDIPLSSVNSLEVLFEEKQNIIINNASTWSKKSEVLRQLNSVYESLVPQEYVNEDSTIYLTKACKKGEKINGCMRPAEFNLKIQKIHSIQNIKDKIEANQISCKTTQEDLLNFSIDELCFSSVYIEKCIRSLFEKCKTSDDKDYFKSLGTNLFYHQIEKVDHIIKSISNYSPSQQFFATSIELLGNEFIYGQDHELVTLGKTILKYPNAGQIASKLFNPNDSSFENFISAYNLIVSSINEYPFDAILVLLSKVNIECILNKRHIEFCHRQKIFKVVCTALHAVSKFELSTEKIKEISTHGDKSIESFFSIKEILKRHFKSVLSFMFPELFFEAFMFLISAMDANELASDLWYPLIQCSGCIVLNENSSMSEIQSSLEEFADNMRLSPDQQIYVSSSFVGINEVKEVLKQLSDHFKKMSESESLYKCYKIHVNPLGIFTAILSHSLLSLHIRNSPKMNHINSDLLWNCIHEPFKVWCHPQTKGNSLKFPWTDEEKNQAQYMTRVYMICLKYFHKILKDYKCDISILSYAWRSYVKIYVSHGLRHYAVNLYHSEFLLLPWHEFYPDAQDIQLMCTVLQSNLSESKEILTKISMQIPWLEILKSMTVNNSPEYVRITLATLGKLLIISGFDSSLTKNNFHRSNLKSLEELPWYFLTLDDVEELLALYYSKISPEIILQKEHENDLNSYMLPFLKNISGFSSSDDYCDSFAHSKRLLYFKKYIYMLNLCISKDAEYVLKNFNHLQSIITSFFTDIDRIVRKGVKTSEERQSTISLIEEILLFINHISDYSTNVKTIYDIQNVTMKSILLWIKNNNNSEILLTLLEISCQFLTNMNHAALITEQCIESIFNREIEDPSEAIRIWNMITSYFKVPSTAIKDEFVKACVQKNGFFSLYCILLERTSQAIPSENKKLLLSNAIAWTKDSKLKENEEQKLLLLWDKILQLCISLVYENEHQTIKISLLEFYNILFNLGEDKSSNGFFGAIGLGQASSLSVNFRFLCRILASFLIVQIPHSMPIRMEPLAPGHISNDAEQKLSAETYKALNNVKSLLKTKPYSALKDLIISSLEYIQNPTHCLLESRQFLRQFSLHVYPRQPFLHILSSELY